MDQDLRERFSSNDLDTVLGIARELDAEGGQVLLVGGCVRDAALDLAPKDLDLEVRGLEADQLRTILARSHGLDEVGKSFGILKLKNSPIEVSLPRTETKAGMGHKGFEVEVDPHLPFPEASARRDFTINAMGLDPQSGELLDPHGGRKDLEDKVLRHVGPAFVEDPLRVLRGMQFVARMQLTAEPETIALCSTIDLEELPSERIFEEWKKLILKGESISMGLRFLQSTTWLRFFPELESLVDCPQDPVFASHVDAAIQIDRRAGAELVQREGSAQELAFAVELREGPVPAADPHIAVQVDGRSGVDVAQLASASFVELRGGLILAAVEYPLGLAAARVELEEPAALVAYIDKTLLVDSRAATELLLVMQGPRDASGSGPDLAGRDLVGLLISAAIVKVYVDTTRVYRWQGALSQVQENQVMHF